MRKQTTAHLHAAAPSAAQTTALTACSANLTGRRGMQRTSNFRSRTLSQMAPMSSSSASLCNSSCMELFAKCQMRQKPVDMGESGRRDLTVRL